MNSQRSYADAKATVAQLRRQDAIDFAEKGDWQTWPLEECAIFQLLQDKLCMDFSHFHTAVTTLLNRPVWTHELAEPGALWEEAFAQRPRANFADVMGKLTTRLRANQTIILVVSQPKEGQR